MVCLDNFTPADIAEYAAIAYGANDERIAFYDTGDLLWDLIDVARGAIVYAQRWNSPEDRDTDLERAYHDLLQHFTYTMDQRENAWNAHWHFAFPEP